MMGPPNVAPNSFQRIFGGALFTVGSGLKLRDHSLALKKSLRRNSNALPWYWLVPDLVLTLITPPRKCPNSAPGLFAITANSWMASTLGENATLLSTNS